MTIFSVRALHRACVLLSILTMACLDKEKSQDKYPDIPYFPESTSTTQTLEKTSLKGLPGGKYIYQIENDTVLIQDKEYHPIKTICIDGYVEHVDPVTGEIFAANDSIVFKYSPPHFTKEKLMPTRVYGSYDSVKQNHPDSLWGLVTTINDSVSNARLSKGIICAIELNNGLYILRYQIKDVLVDPVGFSVRLPDCSCAFGSGFPGAELKPFDKVFLGYSFTGSNHFAIGVESSNLYYYRFIVNKDTLLFKDPYDEFIKCLKATDGRILFSDGKGDIYELKVVRRE